MCVVVLMVVVVCDVCYRADVKPTQEQYSKMTEAEIDAAESEMDAIIRARDEYEYFASHADKDEDRAKSDEEYDRHCADLKQKVCGYMCATCDLSADQSIFPLFRSNCWNINSLVI